MTLDSSGTGKTRIWIDLWIARIGSAIAWFFFLTWTLAGIVGITELLNGEAKDHLDHWMPLICFGIAALHFILIRSFRKTRSLIGDFRLYSSVFSGSETKSVSEIAKKIHADPSVIRERLQEMCRRGYFSGHFDFPEEKMVFADVSPSVLQCPGCGATNKIMKNGDCCIYCGSPMRIPAGKEK